jgi:hemolysin activation/secretion protein
MPTVSSQANSNKRVIYRPSHTKRLIHCAIFSCMSMTAVMSQAQTPPPAPIDPAAIERRQAEQKAALLQQTTRLVNVNTPTSGEGSIAAQPEWQPFTVPSEPQSPCFKIDFIQWKGSDLFDWLTIQAMPVMGKCIGAPTLRKLQDHLSQSVIQSGYVTSRVLIPEQNLSEGSLLIQVVPGVITGKTVAKVEDKTPNKVQNQTQDNTSDIAPNAAKSEPKYVYPKEIGLLAAALPSRKGDLLNQRDLDQALENIRRLPSQDSFAIDIEPGTELGSSVLSIKPPIDPKRLRGSLSLDNTGSTGTGNLYQLGGTLSYDSPLGLYDSLSLNLGSNSNIRVDDKNNRSQGLQWSVPIGYAMFNLGYSRSTYKQTVAGFDPNNPIIYSGKSQGLDIGLAYVTARDANSKDTVSLKLNRKQSISYLNDAEIDVQFKDAVGFDLGYAHRHNFKAATLDVSAGLRGLIPRWTKAQGFIQGQPDWDGSTRIAGLNIGYNQPFKWGEGDQQSSKLSVQYKWQHAYSLIPQSDFFSIGGRYSVRGADESAVVGEHGYLIRSDLSWRIPSTDLDVYIAYDQGAVSGQSTALLNHQRVSGAGLGLKGRLLGMNFDLSYNVPLVRNKATTKNPYQIYGNISVEF